MAQMNRRDKRLTQGSHISRFKKLAGRRVLGSTFSSPVSPSFTKGKHLAVAGAEQDMLKLTTWFSRQSHRTNSRQKFEDLLERVESIAKEHPEANTIAIKTREPLILKPSQRKALAGLAQKTGVTIVSGRTTFYGGGEATFLDPSSAADQQDYVDPILYEMGIFKDQEDYTQSMNRLVEKINTGELKRREPDEE